MATLSVNIEQTITDFNAIKGSIESKGVEVPEGTPTSKYGNLIAGITSGEVGEYIQLVKSGTTPSHTFTIEDIGSITYTLGGLQDIIFNNTSRNINVHVGSVSYFVERGQTHSTSRVASNLLGVGVYSEDMMQFDYGIQFFYRNDISPETMDIVLYKQTPQL